MSVLARLLVRLAALALPWSGRSPHSSWLAGYAEGSADGYARGLLAGRGQS